MKRKMMNPNNWNVDELKEAAEVSILTVSCLLVTYIAICIAY